MRDISVYHVDAFTTEKFTGNTAGVVLDAEKLTEAEMQNIAKELNLSETAFLLPTENSTAHYKVKYFTPTEEVDFCGHATVGISWILATELGLATKNDGIILETNIGNIPVSWKKEADVLTYVEMTQVTPKTKEIAIDLDILSEMIGVQKEEFDLQYPIKLAYTGNWHLIIPIKNDTAINLATPNLSALAKHNREHQITTTHLYTFNTNKNMDLYTRDFAPGIGIPEDPVTGAANGALAGYLYLENIISQKDTTKLIIGQGDTIGRAGLLHITIIPDGPAAPTIKVAGAAVLTIHGSLTL